jgi:rubrerythrin
MQGFCLPSAGKRHKQIVERSFMEERHGLKITTRDRVLRAWQNTTELVRDFETYSREIDDNEEVAAMFAAFAEDEGHHAARLIEVLRELEGIKPKRCCKKKGE